MSAAVSASEPLSALTAVRFLLTADAEPGLLPRLLMPFAKRDLTPDHLASRRSGDTLEVEIAMHAMPSEVVHLVEGNLRQIVGVSRLIRL